jgi:hypothetical protein
VFSALGAALLTVRASVPLGAAEHSRLWGERGEAIPAAAQVANVKDVGAVGDGAATRRWTRGADGCWAWAAHILARARERRSWHLKSAERCRFVFFRSFSCHPETPSTPKRLARFSLPSPNHVKN